MDLRDQRLEEISIYLDIVTLLEEKSEYIN